MRKNKRIIAAVTAAIITATSASLMSVCAENNGGTDHGFVSSSVSAQTDKNESAVSKAQLYDKLGQLLKDGDLLKYGEALYTTGTPDGEKWTKEFYEQRVDFYGEEFLAKYIVNGEFLRDKVVSDMAEITSKENNSELKAIAEDINEYMRSNGISGFTYVREVDGVERIFISYDGFFEKIKAYVVDTGVDESFIVYQQSEDYAIVSDKSENDKSAEESCLKAYAKDISDFMLRSGIAGDAFVRDDKVVVTYSAYEDKIKTYIREKGLDESVIVYEAGKNVADTSEEDKKSTLKETAESINEYMRSNGISGFTYVRAVDGVEKIFISYDGFFEEIQAYVKGKGIDENLVIYQQSYDYNTNESTLKGDANCDGQIDLSDAVIIMQSLANPNKYGIDGTAEHHLTEQGKLNGDMNGDGLTVGDAQTIQKKLLGLDDTDTNQSSENEENNNEAVVSQDVGFGQTWNGKPVSSELYTLLSKNTDENTVIAISPKFKSDESYKYNGKTITEYNEAVSDNNLLDEKLHQILKDGDELKYGELLYTTGTPDGEKWIKELYEERVKFYGEEFLAKYIVNGEFLRDTVEDDIAEFSTQPHSDLNEALRAYKKERIMKAIEQLKQQNIRYEYKEEANDLIINVTVEEFKALSLDNISCYRSVSIASDDGFVSTSGTNQ